jgi:hypothetical protein
MSQKLTAPTKSAPARSGASDLHALAYVEKWMAMIREINREQQGESKFRG